MSLPRYAEYKDSGVAWLGEVPSHWSVTTVKRLTSRISSGKTPFGGSETYVDEGVVFLRSQNVYDEGLRLDDVVFISEDVDETMAMSRVRPGDILLNITGASIGRSCLVPAEFPSANVNQHVCAVRVADAAQAPFVGWIFKSEPIKNQIDFAQNGAAREGLNFDQIGQMVLSIAPLQEQEAIANFLDRETAKIDALIAEQEKLLTLLAEKRQATISHAVTRGLNPNAPMKDSGVPWLGEVPAHWEITSLGRISVSRCDGPFGSGIKSDHYTEEGALVVRLQNIRAYAFNIGEPVYLDQGYFETSLRGHEVAGGDLLVAGLGDDNNLLGRACVAPDGLGAALVKADCFRFRLREEMALPHFVAMQLSAGAAFDAGVMATGTTRSRMPLGVMASRKVALPPLHEQSEVITVVDAKVSKFDVLKEEAEAGIALLKERRSALIAAAVTGKIDVRQAA